MSDANLQLQIEKQLEIIHRQQDTIDSLTKLLSEKNAQVNPTQEEQKIIVAESQKSIGRMPWSVMKTKFEQSHKKNSGVGNFADKLDISYGPKEEEDELLGLIEEELDSAS